MAPPFIIVIPGYVIPSQNVTDRQHWSGKSRINNVLLMIVRAAANREFGISQHLGKRRRVHVTSMRSKRITDDANLRGGAKGIVDCLTRAGVIKDDSDQWVSITYGQVIGWKCTILTVSDME